MNDWQANRNAALDILASLNPDGYQSTYEQLLRGGLSASSMPEGSRSSEKPLPGFDNTDVMLQRERQAQNGDWMTLLEVVRRLESRENALLLVMGVSVPPRDVFDPEWRKAMRAATSKATEELVDIEQGEHRFTCKNCGESFKRTVSQRPRSGRCRACFDYWTAHGRKQDAPAHVTERRK